MIQVDQFFLVVRVLFVFESIDLQQSTLPMPAQRRVPRTGIYLAQW